MSRITVTLSAENRRFLSRLQSEAGEELRRSVSLSEIVDKIVERFREEVELREPRVQKTRDGGLSVPGHDRSSDDWMLAAAQIILRAELRRAEELERGEGEGPEPRALRRSRMGPR